MRDYTDFMPDNYNGIFILSCKIENEMLFLHAIKDKEKVKTILKDTKENRKRIVMQMLNQMNNIDTKKINSYIKQNNLYSFINIAIAITIGAFSAITMSNIGVIFAVLNLAVGSFRLGDIGELKDDYKKTKLFIDNLEVLADEEDDTEKNDDFLHSRNLMDIDSLTYKKLKKYLLYLKKQQLVKEKEEKLNSNLTRNLNKN